MKKPTAFFLAFLLLLPLSACGKKAGEASSGQEPSIEVSADAPDYEGAMVYSEAGTYREAATYEKGVITADGVILENAVFTDYLYIAPEVGDGTVRLRGVAAQKLIVAGGGPDSVFVEDGAPGLPETVGEASSGEASLPEAAQSAEETALPAAENKAKLEERIRSMGWGTADVPADMGEESGSETISGSGADDTSVSAGAESGGEISSNPGTEASGESSGPNEKSISAGGGIREVYLLSDTRLVLKVPVGAVFILAGKLELWADADAVFLRTPDSLEIPAGLKWQWESAAHPPELTLGGSAALRLMDLSGGERAAVYNSGCVFRAEMGDGALSAGGRSIYMKNSGAVGTLTGGGFTYGQTETGYTQSLNVTGGSALRMRGLADSLTVENGASGSEIDLDGLRVNFLTLPQGMASTATAADYKSASYTDEAGGVASADSGAEDPVSYGSSDHAADLAKWKAINADVRAWIEIPGTNISYPIVKGKTNTEYEELDYYRNPSKSGVIWFDCDVRFDKNGNLASQNAVIFGHNWTNLWRPIQYGRSTDIKFAQLAQYESASFAASSPHIYIYTAGGRQAYQVFAAFYCTVNTGRSTDFKFLTNDGSTDVPAIIEAEKKRSLYDTGVSVGSGDQILTLQTCTRVLGNSLGENQKFIVCAKLVAGSGTEGEAVVSAEEVTPRELTTSVKLAAKPVGPVDGAPDGSLCIKAYVDENSISGIEITGFELTEVELLSGKAEVGIVGGSYVYVLPTAAGKVSVSYTALVSYEGAGGSSDSQEVSGSISLTVSGG